MIKTLTKHGNSYALIIDRAILELLRIDPETPLELTTNGQSLIVSPARGDIDQAELDATLKELNNTFGDDLRRLGE